MAIWEDLWNYNILIQGNREIKGVGVIVILETKNIRGGFLLLLQFTMNHGATVCYYLYCIINYVGPMFVSFLI